MLKQVTDHATSCACGVLDSVLTGSGLPQSSRSSTVMRVGVVTFDAKTSSGAGVPRPIFSSTEPNDPSGLQLQFAWPCCIAAAAPGATRSPDATAPDADVIEVHLSPAHAAAAAGVRQLQVRALIIGSAAVLLDTPLVLDTACPVVRWVILGHPASAFVSRQDSAVCYPFLCLVLSQKLG